MSYSFIYVQHKAKSPPPFHFTACKMYVTNKALDLTIKSQFRGSAFY